MALPVKTKWLNSEMTGSPGGLTNAVGHLITVMDAFLVDGFNSQSVTSISHIAGVATLVTPVDHNFLTLQVIEISGANEAQYNGQFRVTEVVDGVTLKFEIDVGSPASATGTLLVKTPGLGWAKEFTGTNKAVYRSLTGVRHYLRVLDDNSDTKPWQARWSAYHSMTDVDNGTDRYPLVTDNSGYRHIKKSESATPRRWDVIGDDKTFYFFPVGGNTTDPHSRFSTGFGEYESWITGETTNSFIGGALVSIDVAGYLAESSISIYAFSRMFMVGLPSNSVASWCFARNKNLIDVSESFGNIQLIGGEANAIGAFSSGINAAPYPDITTRGTRFITRTLAADGSFRGIPRGILSPLSNMTDAFAGPILLPISGLQNGLVAVPTYGYASVKAMVAFSLDDWS